jgi:hypothetical protein
VHRLDSFINPYLEEARLPTTVFFNAIFLLYFARSQAIDKQWVS